MTNLKEQIEKVLIEQEGPHGFISSDAETILDIVEKEVIGCVPRIIEENEMFPMKENPNRHFEIRGYHVCREQTLSRLHSLFAVEKEV